MIEINDKVEKDINDKNIVLKNKFDDLSLCWKDTETELDSFLEEFNQDIVKDTLNQYKIDYAKHQVLMSLKNMTAYIEEIYAAAFSKPIKYKVENNDEQN